MEVLFTQKFKKRFSKLPKKIQNQFESRFYLFIKNPASLQLKNHPLKGYLVGLRAFSISGDYRVIYRILGPDSVKFIDVGTHNQVY